MAKQKKVTENELKQIQSMLNAFNQLKLKLADTELSKQQVLIQITDLKKDYSEVESKLTKKYGVDNRIDVQTGVISEKENIKTE
jgi:putative IMPACT (imprinted ancient) family translation regulator|tara:strand:- start:217 stop:468 length:252 start_codon:yes stop_codon:yes gene_type:complete